MNNKQLADGIEEAIKTSQVWMQDEQGRFKEVKGVYIDEFGVVIVK